MNGLIYNDQNLTGREGRIIFLSSSTLKLSSARTTFAMSLIHGPFFLLENPAAFVQSLHTDVNWALTLDTLHFTEIKTLLRILPRQKNLCSI